MFLAGKRLAFRGDWDSEEHEEEGLFESMFEFSMKKDPRLVDAQNAMPPNVTYRSPTIQNEIIAILADMLRNQIVEEINGADCKYFTILFDGTKDKSGNEIISIAARFISKGQPIEVLLFFETSNELHADAFTKLMLNALEKYGLDPQRIICQCYDGAAVMNGYKSGVAKRLQDSLQKVIPYVHCFNHRLRLVIVDTVKLIEPIRQFFDQIHLTTRHSKKQKLRICTMELQLNA